MKSVAIITGITGQDGAYLAQLLLSKNYVVYGTYRSAGTDGFWRMQILGIVEHPDLHLVELDLTNRVSVSNLIKSSKANEVYNFAAQSYVSVSFSQPVTTSEINGFGALNLLESIRSIDPDIRFYQASSSEMFGKVQQVPQNEKTPFYPRSPYGVSKLFSHWMTINYHEAYDMFAVSGILFNHESPLRDKGFVTRKITRAVARVGRGEYHCLELGNLNAQRDWGYAAEYVEGMWLMLQAKKADSFVLATGKAYTVRDFVGLAFKAIDMAIEWRGDGLDEQGFDVDTGRLLVKVNPEFYRPAEVDAVIGDPRKAERVLGWKARTGLESLCRMMVEADLSGHA